MRCEELEAIVFSGREITAEERAEMEAHAETCEACRALMDNADALRGMQRIDEDVTPPESFTKGWRMAIRQTPRVISISDWMRRKGVRVVGYAACAALVFAAGTGVGRLGGNEKNEARTAYDYDYGAYDTYEAYPQEDAVALYENSAPALGARSAAEKGAANDSTAEDEKKIVRNAWLTLKTERFDEAVADGTIYKVVTTNLTYQTPELLAKPYYINCDMSKYIAYIIDTLNHDSSISDLLNPYDRIQRLVAKYKAEQN